MTKKRDDNDILREEGPDALREAFDRSISEQQRKRHDQARKPEVDEHGAESNGHGFERGYYKGKEFEPSNRFPLLALDDVKLGTAPVYLVKGVIPRTGLAVVWGPPKCGKSFWTFDLCMHIARGREYRGHRVQQGAVVYCAFEGQEGFKARIEAYRQEHHIEPKVPLFLSTHPARLVRDHKTLIAAIRAQLGQMRPAAVALDTLNRSIDGSESKDEDMGNYLSAADAIHLEFGCVVIIVHHCGINDSRPRGHTSLTGTADAQLAVRRNDRDQIITEVEYMKDGPAETRFASKLKTVDLGIDDDGDRITSCVIEPVEADVGAVSRPKTRKQEKWESSLLRKAMMSTMAEHGKNIGPYLDGPVVRGVDQEHVRTEFYRTHPADGDKEAKQDTKRKAFKRDVRQAQDNNDISVREIGEITYLWFGQRPVDPELPLSPRTATPPAHASDPGPDGHLGTRTPGQDGHSIERRMSGPVCPGGLQGQTGQNPRTKARTAPDKRPGDVSGPMQKVHSSATPQGKEVTKWGVTFTVLGAAPAGTECAYCKSAGPDESGPVMCIAGAALHEDCAPAWINNQNKSK